MNRGLQSLLKKLKSASRDDRKLDGLIAWYLDGWKTPTCPKPTDVYLMIRHNGLAIPHYTGSIEDALRLLDGRFPGYDFVLIRHRERGASCTLMAPEGKQDIIDVWAQTPALAICAAIASVNLHGGGK